MLGVRVLGELSIEVDGRAVESPTSRRARSLLGLLAIERRPHSRSQLAARFWPDVLDESARTSLRSALSALRKAIGPEADRYIVTVRDSVGLADEELVWTDIGAFRALVAAGSPREALALCRGELLDGLDDDWIFDAREELRDQLSGLLAQLADEAERGGDLREAAALTRRQVALDPLAESPQRELIRRLAGAGDRPAALAAYRRLQDRLRSELGIVPSAATRELVEALRTGVAFDAPSPAPDRGEAVPAAPGRSADAREALPSASAPSGEPGEAVPAVPERPAGTVTLLFTDQVSSTETLMRLGDDRAERLRRLHFGLLREAASAHRGQEVKNLGDGLMVAFTSAIDAVACAIAMQQAVHGRQETGERDLAVRIGLHVGEPILDEGDYFGTPVVVAKRLCDAAGSGQILASEVVHALVGTRGGFEFQSVGAMPLKGLADPVAACDVRWAPTTSQRIPLPPAVLGLGSGDFVGRSDPVAELAAIWKAVLTGERRVVMLLGEPGIGKSRLTAEFCRDVHAEGASVLAGRCYEETLVPYQPFVEALRHYTASCPPAELTVQLASRRRELAALVPELGPAPALDEREGEAERFRRFDAVASLLREAALLRATVVVLDDLQWADEGSILLLRHVVRATEGSRLLVLGTYRKTELQPAGELAGALAEVRRAGALHQIELGGLPQHDVAALIAARAGESAEDSFVSEVTERTEGNPLFVEELLRHVDGVSGAGLSGLALPEGIKELLLRRLERLDESGRRALAVAAVAGREFDLRVVGRVLGGSLEDLVERLEDAARGHVVVEEPGAIGRYRFAHTLIRETIYEDLSRTRRAMLHRRVGETIESLHAHQLSSSAATLAHHYHLAGDVEKAFEYHCLAVEEAERVIAPETAVEHLTGAIAAGELLGREVRSDEIMRRLYAKRAWALAFTPTQRHVAERDFALALEGARAAGDRRLEMSVLNDFGMFWHVSDSALAIRCQEESLRIAEELADDAGRANALNRLSIMRANQLDLQQALELAERGLALAHEGADEPTRLRALDSLKLVSLLLGDVIRLDEVSTVLSSALRRRQDIWYLQWALEESAFASTARGQWDESARRLDEALAINRRIGDMGARPLILEARCQLERARGNYAQALSVGGEAVEIATVGRTLGWLGWVAVALALALTDLRAFPEALAALEPALAEAQRVDERAQRFAVLGLLAWVRLRGGDARGAREACEQWDAVLEQIRVPPGQAYLYAWPSYIARARAARELGQVDRAEAILAQVKEPIERFGLREASARVHALLAACALDRGLPGAAGPLLTRGLELLGPDGFPAARLELGIALARLDPARDGGHAQVAQELIERVAGSAGEAQPAQRFRAAALAELAGSEPPASLAASGPSHHATS